MQYSLARAFPELADLFYGDLTAQDTTTNHTSARTPQCNLFEDADGFIIVAQMPGVTRENLDVSFENGVLSVEGKIETIDSKAYVREFSNTGFSRKFKVADAVDVEHAKAELKDGILCLHIPKAERAKSRKISVL